MYKRQVNWTQIGNVLERPTQLKVQDIEMSAGVYAPDIAYNPHNDTFYMITTHIGGGLGNIVVKTKDPRQGWGDPIRLEFNGIDPALFFDDDGKAYLVHNDAPDHGKELYSGHRAVSYTHLKPSVLSELERSAEETTMFSTCFANTPSTVADAARVA